MKKIYYYGAEEYTKKGLHPLYRTWYGMHRRCRVSKGGTKNVKYLEKGIAVCERWKDFQTFVNDMGVKPKGYTLERTNNAKGYQPDNCIWADWETQCENRDDTVTVEYKGNKVTLYKLAKEFDIDRKVLHNRVVCMGWELERALTQKVAHSRKKK